MRISLPPADRYRPRPNAVVVGLDCITGLQTARILAAGGFRVFGVAARPKHFCCRTRAVERVVPQGSGEEALVQALLRLGEELNEPAALVPCSDLAVLAISAHRARLEARFRFALPDHEVVLSLMDKERFHDYAVAQGLPVPGTRLLHDRTEAQRAAAELEFPVVLKPRLKTAEWQRRTKTKAFKVASAGELLAVYDRVCGWAKPLLVQEWIEGGEDSLYSCNCYYDAAGTPLVTFVARKLRQWPPQTGTSCLGEECRNDAVLDCTLQLFGGAGYRGYGYVEMKRDARSGRHVIIEPNVGRLTGRSAIAEAGGVELVLTGACSMLGLTLPERRVQQYRGAKWMYLRHDFQSAFHYWRRGELTIAEWWRTIRGPKRDAVFSWRDPAPFWGDMAQSLGQLAPSTRRNGVAPEVPPAGATNHA